MLLCGGAVHAAAPLRGPRYVIVTTQAVVDISEKLDAFVASKRARGFVVSVATEADWGGGATGVDRSGNLRDWLHRQWLNRATRPTYVLLIGDPRTDGTDGVPMRMACAGRGDYFAQKIPTDVYYAELTANWDRDGDGKIGELGQDLAPKEAVAAELIVGRIPFYGAIAGYPVFKGKGGDDLTTGGALVDAKATAVYDIRIAACGKPDMYAWSSDGGETWSRSLPMDGRHAAMCPGFTPVFATGAGHTEGDRWTIELAGDRVGRPKFEGKGVNDLKLRRAAPLKDKKPRAKGKRTIILKVLSVGGPDAFEYRSRKGAEEMSKWSDPLPMTGGPQVLEGGIKVKFQGVFRHEIGDTWRFHVRQYLDSILAKTIAYENAELSSIGWRFRALLPINELFADGSGYPLGEEIRKKIVDGTRDWTSHRIYKKSFDLKPAPETVGLSYQEVTKQWQKFTPGVVMWVAHGQGRFADSLLHSRNALELDDSRPVINFHTSCLTGLPEDPLNLSTSLLRNGAVAVVSSTRVTYGDLKWERNSFVIGTHWRESANDIGLSYRFTRELILKRRNVGQALDIARRSSPPRSVIDWVTYLGKSIYGCPAVGIYTHRRAADGTPEWYPGYPRIEQQATGARLVRVRANLSGRVYWVVLPDGGKAPTSAQVKAGQNAAGKQLPAGHRGLMIMARAMSISAAMKGAEPGGAWDVYTVAESMRGVLQAVPTKVTP